MKKYWDLLKKYGHVGDILLIISGLGLVVVNVFNVFSLVFKNSGNVPIWSYLYDLYLEWIGLGILIIVLVFRNLNNKSMKEQNIVLEENTIQNIEILKTQKNFWNYLLPILFIINIIMLVIEFRTAEGFGFLFVYFHLFIVISNIPAIIFGYMGQNLIQNKLLSFVFSFLTINTVVSSTLLILAPIVTCFIVFN